MAAARLYNCLKCNAQVIICSKCDRGHRYCMNGCAELARKESLQRAAKAHRKTHQCKEKSAARQQKSRDKKKQIVTHQGSQEIATRDVLQTTSAEQEKFEPEKPEKAEKAEKATKVAKQTALFVCHRCGCSCDTFLRLDFITANRFVDKILYQ